MAMFAPSATLQDIIKQAEVYKVQLITAVQLTLAASRKRKPKRPELEDLGDDSINLPTKKRSKT